MRSAPVVRITIGLLVVVLAAVGYSFFIPVKILHPSLMSRLLVTTSGLPSIQAKSTFSAPLPTATNSVQEIRTTAAQFPSTTGTYATDWFGQGSNPSSIQLQVAILPNVTTATSVLAAAETQDIGTKALKAGNHKLKSSFAIASGSGVTYLTPQVAKPGTKPGPPVPGGALDARVGRAVLRETLSGSVSTQANLVALAARETVLLKRELPGFPPLQTTHIPIVASIVYIVVALLLAVALALVPDWYRFVRDPAQRRAQQEARARRQYSTRGSKALRRHRVRI